MTISPNKCIELAMAINRERGRGKGRLILGDSEGRSPAKIIYGPSCSGNFGEAGGVFVCL